jgi:hypothetical protein
MKLSANKNPWKSGFVSYVLVLSTGTILLLMMVFAYKQAIADSQVQGKGQLLTDYSEKEEAIVRAIVSITPNKAVRVMQADANTTEAQKNALKWSQIFRESITKAGIKNPSAVAGITNGNVGNGDLENQVSDIFSDVVQRPVGSNDPVGLITSGVNVAASSLQGTGYPVPLTSDANTRTVDLNYPVISGSKQNTVVPIDEQRNGYSLMPYPNISFAYATPGSNFLAKRNWWAFSVDASNPNRSTTQLNSPKRKFVLSIYEVPSQLAISASTKLALGKYSANGTDWDTEKVSITGNVYAGNANLEGSVNLAGIAVKKQINFGGTSKVGGESYQSNDPFKAGVRETARLSNQGALPVSKASDSGRCNFISFNPGEDFFDRHLYETAPNQEPMNPINNNSQRYGSYVVGAKQCAMWLDVLDIRNSAPDSDYPTYNSPLSSEPTYLRLTYRTEADPNATAYTDIDYRQDGAGLTIYSKKPDGFSRVAADGGSHSGAGQLMDYAYGSEGTVGVGSNPNTGYSFIYRSDAMLFNESKMGNPGVAFREGFARPAAPFRIRGINKDGNNKQSWGIEFEPMKLKAFLDAIRATALPEKRPAELDINNSISINVDTSSINSFYRLRNSAGIDSPSRFKVNLKDNAPMVLQYGVILKGCSNLTDFTKGFSLVTDMRLFVGDDFNAVTGVRPINYPAGKPYYVPCSLFAPQKRYGFDADATKIDVKGQMGSLADDRGNAVGTNFESVRLLDSKQKSYDPNDPTKGVMTSAQIKVNLFSITNINEVPPIMMKNWLITAEEIRN